MQVLLLKKSLTESVVIIQSHIISTDEKQQVRVVNVQPMNVELQVQSQSLDGRDLDRRENVAAGNHLLHFWMSSIWQNLVMTEKAVHELHVHSTLLFQPLVALNQRLKN